MQNITMGPISLILAFHEVTLGKQDRHTRTIIDTWCEEGTTDYVMDMLDHFLIALVTTERKDHLKKRIVEYIHAD